MGWETGPRSAAGRIALGLILAIAVIVAGCNGDDDTAASSSATVSGSDSGASSDTGDDAGDDLVAGGDASQAIAARDYDATVVNPVDGTRIAITAMQPALAAGEAAPLILHSHGFGGARLPGRDDLSIYEQLTGGTLPSSEAARQAAKDGYFVISFDERGFGESGGTVEVMDPRYEGEDIKAILDWAENQMANNGHLGYRDGNLVLGSLGLSYGGGFQLIGAGVDPRFDALVPTAAWYDLTYSLSPDDIIKSSWGVLLVGLGVPTSRVRLDPVLYQALLEGLAAPLTGAGFSADVKDRLYNNSPVSFCNASESENGEPVPSASGRTTPRVDALIIQGTSDTLFTLNEGWENAQCLRAAGNDVDFIGMRYGHTIPTLQTLDTHIAYETEATLHCGDREYDTATMELGYLNWKLRGTPPDQPIPDNCLTIDDDQGLVFDTLPVADPDGANGYAFSGTAVTGGLPLLLSVLRTHTVADLLQLVGTTVDNAASLLSDLLDPTTQPPNDATVMYLLAQILNALPSDDIDQILSEGRFIPLTTIANSNQALAGIPVANVTIHGNDATAIAFLGIGVQHGDAGSPELVDSQIRPVRGSGERRIELNGISQRLQAGDTVGLLVYGFHPQYVASFSLLPGVLDLDGRIGLPLVNVP